MENNANALTLDARIFTPGAGWGPTVVLSDGSGSLQDAPWTAIGDDGTAVVGWREVINQPSFESQVMVRTYTPGGGWAPAQKLSTLGGFGAAAVAPDGRVHMGGRCPVNPSGGLLSKGEPLGASALGQVVELVHQLRGEAGPRQVEGARVGLAHTVGRGANACCVIVTR